MAQVELHQSVTPEDEAAFPPADPASQEDPTPPKRWTRRRVASVATTVVVAVTLGVMLGVYLWPSGASASSITTGEESAMQAAGETVVNLLTYSRASFDDDYNRALGGTTGKLHDDMAGAKARTLKTMTKGGFDLAAKLDSTALVPAPDATTKVLVLVSGWTVNDAGKTSQQKIERVEMTMANEGGKWLASDLEVPDGAYRATSSSDDRQQVVDDASSCLSAMNTYDYRSMPTARQNGLACTTGAFTDHYGSSFDQVATAAAKSKTSQTFEVTGVGLESLSAGEAKVLVFAQIESTTEGSTPEYAVVSAEATMKRVDGTWKVSGYRTTP